MPSIHKDNWIIYKGIGLCLIPKAGLNSFRAITNASNSISAKEVTKLTTVRVAFMRDPIERFYSNYRFFHFLNKDRPDGFTQVPLEKTSNGFEVWVDYALEVANTHWCNQVDVMDGAYTILHKFNNPSIHKHWPTYWPGKLPDWKNAMGGTLPMSDYKADKIIEYYAPDIELFNTIGE